MIEPTSVHLTGEEALRRPPIKFPVAEGGPEAAPPERPQPREVQDPGGISDESVEENRFREDIRKDVEELNQVAKDLGHRLSYDVYEETEEFFVRVFDRRTNELVKMIPPEKILDLRARIQNVVGSILDEEA